MEAILGLTPSNTGRIPEIALIVQSSWPKRLECANALPAYNQHQTACECSANITYTLRMLLTIRRNYAYAPDTANREGLDQACIPHIIVFLREIIPNQAERINRLDMRNKHGWRSLTLCKMCSSRTIFLHDNTQPRHAPGRRMVSYL